MSFRLFLCCLFVSCCLQISAQDIDKSGPPGSSLVFGDEFNAEVLDAAMWGLGINENCTVISIKLKASTDFRKHNAAHPPP